MESEPLSDQESHKLPNGKLLHSISQATGVDQGSGGKRHTSGTAIAYGWKVLTFPPFENRKYGRK